MGTTVTLTANQAPAGHEFDKWIVTGVVVADANSATTTLVMPAGNVSAEATYKDIPVVTYTVTFDGNGGTGSMDAATGVSCTTSFMFVDSLLLQDSSSRLGALAA